MEKHFRWADRDWYIPSVYTCEQGMVVDILMRVDATDIRAFMDKWGVTPENERNFTREQRRQMEQENPLIFRFRSALNINGKELQNKRGCSMVFIPCMPESYNEEQMAILDYYNLNPADGWVIQRSTYPWEKQGTEITTLEITMRHQPMFLPGTTFEVKAPGETYTFTNPVTGLQHTLTVQKFEKQEQSFDHPDMKHMEFPKHHIAMTFTLEPDMPQTQFSITDSVESDSPRVRPRDDGETHPSGAACVGIIGGADGPTVFIYGTPKSKEQLHASCSGFRFEPMDTVTWQLSFREKQEKALTVELM